MKNATCHPEQRYEARGLCRRCYRVWYWRVNKKKAQQQYRDWKKNNPDKYRASWKRRDYASSYFKFGLTVAEYKKLSARFNGICPICGRKDRRRLSVDRCHVTGKIRGMICDSCNIALGKMQDNTIWLKRAIKYLEGKLFKA